uniref:MAGUK p55 subfamily member 5 n=1 Tax=Steinernema glaseri TaxID=37863 RepID=A0A1I7ZZ37_9BILA
MVAQPLKRPESIALGSFRRRRLANCPSTASTSSSAVRTPLPGFVILVARGPGQRVTLYGTPADRAGLCVGDEIVEVNGHCVEGREHAEIVDLIHQARVVPRSAQISKFVNPRNRNRGGTNPQSGSGAHSGSAMSTADVVRFPTDATKRSELSLALEVVVPTEELRCAVHHDPARGEDPEECTCRLVENELLVFNEFQGAKCIKSRIIQLRVRRKHDQNNEEEGRAEGSQSRVSDAYFVSVDKDHIKEVGKRLKRNYPGLRTYDMETVAALPPGQLPEPLSARSSSAGQAPLSQSNLQVHDEFHGVACAPEEVEDSGHGSSGSPTLDDQKERLRKYEEDLRKRREIDEKRAKENAFLRSSIRASKKLQQLEAKNGSTKIVKPILLAEADASRSTYVNQEEAPVVGYTNECYVTGEHSIREELKAQHPEGDAIPLEQVIVSANRVAEHLEQAEGRLEESRIIRDYFSQEPVQQAIQATAVHRSREMMTQQPTTSSSSELSFDQVSSEALGNLKVVKFYKSEDSYLGATVRNDGERVVIGRVVKGGIAEKSRLLKEGDELIEVNGTDLRGRSVADVCDLLRTLSGEVSFVFVPAEEPETRSPSSQKAPAPVVQHMRALFDYDPEDDFYMPCKELGLSFRRGDILHVISMADENWWQAYRDGDENHQSLAGLVPSASFQQQVILYNREMDRENGRLPGKEADIFGCAKKKSAPKKTFGKKASADLKSKDEMVDSDQEILTYEDVSLYLSRTGRKRPIVLCGPEGVGTLELRQRLIESDKDRFASAVPHTTRAKKLGEVDGVQFHFVSKARFQEDAKGGRFVEFGEFQKALYGTSVAAIKHVVEQSKSCLLSLKPESLKALRLTDLMPYVIFVAPPSLQQLRRQKEMLGQHGVKDDQLKAILNQGKQLEMEFGHLFDTVVVNVDLDRTLKELAQIVQRIDTEPQWVPSFWVAGPLGSPK